MNIFYRSCLGWGMAHEVAVMPPPHREEGSGLKEKMAGEVRILIKKSE
ncbi:MAG: hypothetical protein IH591_18550 [Bacteroidales bacterium]|nr:hypothetical protein [Bacteroidales bacterium]